MDYFDEGCRINGACYAEELRPLHQDNVKKRRRNLTQDILLFKIMHQPTPLKLLWQLQLNADLRSSFIPVFSRFRPFRLLFPNLKTYLYDRNFGSNEGDIDALLLSTWGVGGGGGGAEDEKPFFEEISKLEQCWRKCMRQSVIILRNKGTKEFLLFVIPKVQGPRIFYCPS